MQIQQRTRPIGCMSTSRLPIGQQKAGWLRAISSVGTGSTGRPFQNPAFVSMWNFQLFTTSASSTHDSGLFRSSRHLEYFQGYHAEAAVDARARPILQPSRAQLTLGQSCSFCSDKARVALSRDSHLYLGHAQPRLSATPLLELPPRHYMYQIQPRLCLFSSP